MASFVACLIVFLDILSLQKPFKCEDCGLSFSRHATLAKHQEKAMHGGPYDYAVDSFVVLIDYGIHVAYNPG